MKHSEPCNGLLSSYKMIHDASHTYLSISAINPVVAPIEMYQEIDYDFSPPAKLVIEEHADALIVIDRFVTEISKSSLLLWEQNKSRNGLFEKTALGQAWVHRISMMIRLTEFEELIKVTGRRLSEECEAFFRIAKRRRFYPLHSRDAVSWGRPQMELQNFLVSCIQKITASRKYLDAVRHRHLQSKRNYESGVNFFNKAFQKCSSLLVGRIDLGYLKDATHNMTPEHARKDLEGFFRTLRKTENKELTSSFIGYIRKLEFKPRKWYHFHLVLVFNGHSVKSHWYYANLFINLWKEVTDGRGIGHNCSENIHSYRHVAIGKINVRDTDKRALLEKYVVGYLTKSDEYSQAITGGMRRFQCSAIAPRKSSAGRPRLPMTNKSHERGALGTDRGAVGGEPHA